MAKLCISLERYLADEDEHNIKANFTRPENTNGLGQKQQSTATNIH